MAEAVKWYRKAAEKWDATAMEMLANCYRFGKGVEPDEAEANRWDQQANAVAEANV